MKKQTWIGKIIFKWRLWRRTTVLEKLLPGSNPFHSDAYDMGTRMGTNCWIMFSNHADQFCPYLIVIDDDTGERFRIDFKQEGK